MLDFTASHPYTFNQENTINRYYTTYYSNIFMALRLAIHQYPSLIYASLDAAFHCHVFHNHEQKDMFVLRNRKQNNDRLQNKLCDHPPKEYYLLLATYPYHLCQDKDLLHL